MAKLQLSSRRGSDGPPLALYKAGSRQKRAVGACSPRPRRVAWVTPQRRLSLAWDAGSPILRVFGPALQCGATDLMITPVPKLIAYISKLLLLPGDLIVPGTAGGGEAKRSSPFWLDRAT